MHAIDRPFEAARHVQMALRVERHRRGVHDAGDIRLAPAVRAHAENRDRHFLPATSAVGDVEIAIAIEDGIVYLMKTRRQWNTDFEQRRFAGDVGDAHGGPTSVEAWRNEHGNRRRGRVDGPRGRIADRDIREMGPVDREAGAVDGDPPAFHGPVGLNRGEPCQNESLIRIRPVRIRPVPRSSTGSRASCPARFAIRS